VSIKKNANLFANAKHGLHLPPSFINLANNIPFVCKEGWTLWSFQFRNTLALWWSEIEKAKRRKVLVLCSNGSNARDPQGQKIYCSYYSLCVPKTLCAFLMRVNEVRESRKLTRW
jgi:hypothetical protein